MKRFLALVCLLFVLVGCENQSLPPEDDYYRPNKSEAVKDLNKKEVVEFKD